MSSDDTEEEKFFRERYAQGAAKEKMAARRWQLLSR